MKRYFYSDGKEKHGPYTEEELLTKKLELNTLIWYEGLDDWITLSKVPELKEKFFKIPPPLPTEKEIFSEFEPVTDNKKYYYIIASVLALLLFFYFFNKESKSDVIKTNDTEESSNQSETKEEKILSSDEAIKIAVKKFKKYSSKIESSKDAVISFSKEYSGDLNDDGLTDVVIFFALSPAEGGNISLGRGLSVYINYGDEIKPVAGFEPDYPFEMIGIEKNRIHIVEEKYAPSDYPNFPSLKENRYFILNGSNLREVY